jgi:putative acetyltransferase
MAPTIRPYQRQDRAAMVLVYYRAIREGAAAFYSEAERAAWAKSPEPNWDKPDKLLDQWCYVAEEDGRMTGFMSMDDKGYLDMAFVIPEVMGKGTAAALYDVLMAQAKSAGLTHFSVRAAHQSNRFLTRRGWKVDLFERYAADGQVYDQFQMSLTLAVSP